MPFLFLIILILSVLFLIMLISVIIGVPFLPTHMKQARLMMQLAEIKPGMKVIDLGSGAGRLLWLAADKGALVVGYELNPFLFWWTKIIIMFRGLSSKATVRCQSLYGADLHDADVVFAFLFPGPMAKLANKLFSELKPCATIVSYTFSIPGHTPIKKQEGIFVYKV